MTPPATARSGSAFASWPGGGRPTRPAVFEDIRIADLRPTQASLGFREVEHKRRKLREQAGTAGEAYLARHPITAVAGPKGRRYLIDRHHLARALQEEGRKRVLIGVVADLSEVSEASFWRFLDLQGWSHPYDPQGKRLSPSQMPTSLADLNDDPYRSLAGDLRRAGAYRKDHRPFSEFLWADFLRQGIAAREVEENYAAALAKATTLATDKAAAGLPGWRGAVKPAPPDAANPQPASP